MSPFRSVGLECSVRSNDDQKRCRRSFRRLTDSEDDESFDGDERFDRPSIAFWLPPSCRISSSKLMHDKLVQVLTALPEQKIAGNT